MIIEYIGLPGAGKTYLIKQRLQCDNVHTFVKINSNIEKFYFCLVYFITHPCIFLRLLITTVRRTPCDFSLLKYKILFLLMTSIARESKALSLKNAVLDEGLCQFMLSMYDSTITPNDFLNDWSLFIKYNNNREIIFVEAPRKTRNKRLVERGRTPRRSFSAEYQLSFAEVLEVNYITVKQVLENKFQSISISNH